MKWSKREMDGKKEGKKKTKSVREGNAATQRRGVAKSGMLIASVKLSTW